MLPGTVRFVEIESFGRHLNPGQRRSGSWRPLMRDRQSSGQWRGNQGAGCGRRSSGRWVQPGPAGEARGGQGSTAGASGRWRPPGHGISRLRHRHQKPERGAKGLPLIARRGVQGDPKRTKPNGRAWTRPDRWAPHFQRENGGCAFNPEWERIRSSRIRFPPPPREVARRPGVHFKGPGRRSRRFLAAAPRLEGRLTRSSCPPGPLRPDGRHRPPAAAPGRCCPCPARSPR